MLDLIARKPARLELVLTGRGARKCIKDKADLVSEIKEVKHPFYRGEKARKGIDY